MANNQQNEQEKKKKKRRLLAIWLPIGLGVPAVAAAIAVPLILKNNNVERLKIIKDGPTEIEVNKLSAAWYISLQYDGQDVGIKDLKAEANNDHVHVHVVEETEHPIKISATEVGNFKIKITATDINDHTASKEFDIKVTPQPDNN
ncbi:MAG: hypothetical protein HUJ52_03515 [Malacoplasma sp.]|nr:hypothetical protein [Malacoplasma sp.]